MGHKSGTKYVISQLLETPRSPDESFSASWIAEHAIQVRRMLIGGFHHLGFYAVDKVKARVTGLAQAAFNKLKKTDPDCEALQYLLYGDESSWYCYLVSDAGAMQEIPHQFTEPESLIYLTATWNVNLRFGLSEKSAVISQLESAIKREVDRVLSSLGRINGELIASSSNEPIRTLKNEKDLKEKLKRELPGDIEVQLFLKGLQNCLGSSCGIF